MSYNHTDLDFKPPLSRLEGYQKTVDPLSKALLKLDNPFLYTPEAQRENRYLGIFLSTNESGIDRIYQRCLEKPLVTNACHIGFSGWYNLNIVALRRSQRAIICDINPENSLFFDFTLKFLRESISREEFFKNLKELINDYNYDIFEQTSKTKQKKEPGRHIEEKYCFEISLSEFDSPIDELLSYKDNPYSWLYTEERYQYIRKLALQGRIVSLTQDIRDYSTFEKIKRLIQDNGDLTIDTLYVSNIPSNKYMKSPLDWASFIHTMYTLVQKDTLIIDADFEKDTDVLVQKLTIIGTDISRQLLEELWKCPEPEAQPKSESSLTVTASITLLILTCVASICLFHFNKTPTETFNRLGF